MFGFFGSVFGFFRNLTQLVTGKTNEQRKILARNPHVINTKFEEARKQKQSRANQLLNAIAAIETESVKMEKRIKEDEAKIAKLEALAKNAYDSAESRVNALKGDKEAVLKDQDYNEAKAAYAKFNAEVAALKESLGGADGNGGMKAQYEQLRQSIRGYEDEHRKMIADLQSLELRKNRVIADIKSAEAQEEIVRQTAGISDDIVETDLQEIESMAQESRSRSNVISRLNSTNSPTLEEKFSQIGANNEFDNMFKFKDQSQESPDRDPAKLPE